MMLRLQFTKRVIEEGQAAAFRLLGVTLGGRTDGRLVHCPQGEKRIDLNRCDRVVSAAGWRTAIRVPALSVLALAIVINWAGCGSGVGGRIAAQVGDISISKATVDHWAHALEISKKVASEQGGGPHRTARE